MSELHILVVDDDRDFAESLTEVLQERGHAVELAVTGPVLLSLFDEFIGA